MSRRLCQGGATLFFLFLLLAVGWISNTKAYAASPVLTLNLPAITATVGRPWSGIIATGTDSLAGDTLTSTIEWGDGSQSHQTVTLTKSRTFQVHASHTFTTAGSFLYEVSVTSATSRGIVDTATVTITAAKALKLGNPCIFTQGKTAFLIVTFSDNQESTKVADYKATINWGDGTTTKGTIWNNRSSNDFILLDKHKYKHHGTFAITLTITGPGGSSVTKTKTIVI